MISGGQTGADQAGLRAARALGIPTGGTAPDNFWTEAGCQVDLLRSYGLTQVAWRGYEGIRKRTIANVRNADATVWFGKLTTPGYALTIHTCQRQQKPHLLNPSAIELAHWWTYLVAKPLGGVLNVAGNRESVTPGIGVLVEELLLAAWRSDSSGGGSEAPAGGVAGENPAASEPDAAARKT